MRMMYLFKFEMLLQFEKLCLGTGLWVASRHSKVAALACFPSRSMHDVEPES